ncbi:MAG: hypothetical protein WBX11_02365 [Thiobacillaceae bacterium]
MAIGNDSEFKAALSGLSTARQRMVAVCFAENVLALCHDARVKGAINTAKRTDITDAELAAAFQTARAASVETFTQCGHECNWISQAGHFVAEASMACVKPAEPGGNLSWDAAMLARMARTCETIANGRGTDNAEAIAQYRILAEFLDS